jgi:DNA-binding MarR family transcriptional regulator
MVALASPRATSTAVRRAGRVSVWVSRISRALAQQMLLYARRELELNLAEYRALSMLAECRSASIKDVAAGTELDKAQITRAIANLTRRGFAIHTVDGRDRRLRVVKLTPAGRALVARSVPFAIARQTRMERALTPAELRTLWKALGILSEEAQAMLAEEEQTPHRPKRGRGRANS